MQVRNDDHDAFAARLKKLSVHSCSPVKASTRAASYAASSLKRAATTSIDKVERLKDLLDNAGSALGIPPLPASPPPRQRLGNDNKGVKFQGSSLAAVRDAARDKVEFESVVVPSWGDSPKPVKPRRASHDGVPLPAAPPPPVKPRRMSHDGGPLPAPPAPLRRHRSAPLKRGWTSSAPPPLARSASAIAAPVGATAGGRRATICTLSSVKKKEVLLIFDAFAMMIERPANKGGEAGGGGGAAAADSASSLLSGFAGNLTPTRRSFEGVLKLYYPSQSADEREAMLALVAGPLDALVCGRWAARAKAQHGADIKRAFARVDKDGSGGIDISEFAVAVEAANIDESHVRTLFEAADANGDGVLDIDEFVDLVATSAVLRPIFGDLLASAKQRKDKDEYERLATIFRNPMELNACVSPSGRKRRPTLSDLRSVHDMVVPYAKKEPLPKQGLAFSPPKAQVRPARAVLAGLDD